LYTIKKTILFFTALFIFTSLNFNVYALNNTSEYSTPKNISSSKNNINIKGYIPIIKNLTNPIFQYNLNQTIQKNYEEIILDASKNSVRTITISYDVISSDNFLSIILYVSNTNKKTSSIKTFVVDKTKNKYAKINDILGVNGLGYANKMVSNLIKNDKTTNYFNTSAVTENTPFYVKNENVVIPYGAGEIAAVSNGIINFEVPKGNIYNYTVKNYYTKTMYNIKMIPIREVVEHFGYTVLWNSKTETIQINKGSEYITSIKVGRNSYPKSKASPKFLESAPEIKNSKTYVPVSFFEEILDLLYAPETNGDITISSYKL